MPALLLLWRRLNTVLSRCYVYMWCLHSQKAHTLRGSCRSKILQPTRANAQNKRLDMPTFPQIPNTGRGGSCTTQSQSPAQLHQRNCALSLSPLPSCPQVPHAPAVLCFVVTRTQVVPSRSENQKDARQDGPPRSPAEWGHRTPHRCLRASAAACSPMRTYPKKPTHCRAR